MRFLSLCSGIEAASVAWHPLGWRAVAFSEIDRFPSAVLSYRYPDVPNLGDMTRFQEWPNLGTVDLVVGGTPCQSYSVAGLRAGLDDPRGDLMLTFGAVARRVGARWLVWENVPGVLSSNGGRDFGTFLGLLAELGYGFAYRVLDAQFFGLAQRRQRVFVVGCLGDWRSAAAVLFERSSLSGDPAPSREAGQRVAGTLTACPGTGRKHGHGWGQQDFENGYIQPIALALNAHGGAGRMDGESETFIPVAIQGTMIGRGDAAGPAGCGFSEDGVSFTLTKTDVHAVAHALRAEGFDAGEDGTGRGTPLVAVGFNARQDPDSWLDRTGPIDTDGSTQAVAFHENQRGELSTSETAGSLKTSGGKPWQGYPAVMERSLVRRLTPLECERLQGFPDQYTLIPYRGGMAKDGPRYKALGNSMAVPCMRWIGERIALVEALRLEAAA